MRLKSGLFVAAYIRRCEIGGAFAVLRRRGAEEGGAIFVKIDLLDGRARVIGPAPQSDYGADAADRRFAPLHDAPSVEAAEAERLLARQIRFDPDLWIVEVEDRQGRDFLD